MKKTLIALTLAAAAVSGSAMAWTQNGTGGSLELSGTLTPEQKVTPWEVQVGIGVTGLDAPIKQGQQVVNIPIPQSLPVFGIRTQTNQAFVGQTGIAPQIDFSGNVDLTSFAASQTALSLEVKDNNAVRIGTLTVPIIAGAELSRLGLPDTPFAYVQDARLLIGGDNTNVFTGGLPVSIAGVDNAITSRLTALNGEFTQHYNNQGAPGLSNTAAMVVTSDQVTYSAYYGSGIEAGKPLTITLDKPVVGDTQIQWNASLPVIVTYS